MWGHLAFYRLLSKLLKKLFGFPLSLYVLECEEREAKRRNAQKMTVSKLELEDPVS